MMETKPKVLFLTDVAHFKGGAEHSLFDLMANPTITPLLAGPDEGEISARAAQLGIPFYKINYGSVLTVRRPFKIFDIFRTFGAAISAARQLKNIARREGALCCHTNGLKAHGIGALARLWGGAPLVAHFRAIPFTAPEKIFWHMVQIIASKIIFVSRPCWPGRKLPGNGQVIFNAIKIPPRNSVMPSSTNRPFIIGFTGRIQHTKGVDILIEWFEYALAQGLDLRLSIRGEAAPDEIEYDTKCRGKVRAAALEDRVEFTGRLQGLDKIYAGIHVNIVPSIVPDPLPRAVMESAVLGIPVLAYPAGGIPDMIEDGASGFLVKNREEFFVALKGLYENPGLLRQVGQASQRSAAEKFAMARLHREITDVYVALKTRQYNCNVSSARRRLVNLSS